MEQTPPCPALAPRPLRLPVLFLPLPGIDGLEVGGRGGEDVEGQRDMWKVSGRERESATAQAEKDSADPHESALPYVPGPVRHVRLAGARPFP